MISIELGAVHQYSVGSFVEVRDVVREPRSSVVSVCTSDNEVIALARS